MSDDIIRRLLEHLRFGGGAGVKVHASMCLPLADAIEALTAVQPDAREAALLEAAEICDKAAQETDSPNARYELFTARDAVLALIDKPGKEVTPDERPDRFRPSDAAPAGLSAGGGAEPATKGNPNGP
jgi:hypothetical protein